MSLVEILLAVGILMLLAAMGLAMVGKARESARRIQCAANLRTTAMSFLQYAADHNSALPDPLAEDVRWESLLLPYARTMEVFRCPSDEEVFPTAQSSFDWRDTGEPETTLAGRKLVEISRPGVVLAFEALSGWHLKDKMNVAGTDASVQIMSEQDCLRDLTLPVKKGNPKPIEVPPNQNK
ncbi:MAG: hypothetical protein ACREIT_07050 [Tepidisphaeraceae bacterium]